MPHVCPMKKRYWIPAATLCVLLVAALATPTAVEWYLERWLHQQGVADAAIDDIDIHPFKGILRLEGTQFGASTKERGEIGLVEVDVSMADLFSRDLTVESARVENAILDLIDKDEFAVGGLRLPEPAPEAEPTAKNDGESFLRHIAVRDVALIGIELRYRSELVEHELVINRVRFGGFGTRYVERPSTLVADLHFDGNPFLIDASLTPLAASPSATAKIRVDRFSVTPYRERYAHIDAPLPAGVLSADLDTTVTRQNDGHLDIAVTGDLAYENASIEAGELSSTLGQIAWNGEFQSRFLNDGSIDATLAGTLQQTGIVVQTSDATLNVGSVSWDGVLEARLDNDETLQASIDGELGVDGANAETSELAASIDELSWQGQLNAIVDDSNQIDLQGDWSFSLDTLRAAGNSLPPVSVDALRLTDIVQIGLQAISDGTLRMEGFSAFDENAAPVSLASLSASGIAVNADNDLTIDDLALSGLVARLRRQPDGTLDLVEALAGPTLTAKEDSEAASESEKTAGISKPVFRVSRATIGGDSRLRFEDAAVSPPAVFDVAVDAVSVDGLSNAPDAEPTDVDVSFRINVAPVEVAGTVSPFSESVALDLNMKASDVDLTRISAYVPGLNIDRGRLALDTAALVSNGKLDVSNAVTIDRLRVRRGEGESILGGTLNMPLDVALDLLRDGDDRISLDIPVSGSLSDPSFSLDDVVRTATGNALQQAAVRYAVSALQPLGTILFVSKVAGKATRPRFDPIEFAAGGDTISGSGGDYLEKIATLLERRPGLSITLCGVATAVDRQVFEANYLASFESVEQADGMTEADTDSAGDDPQTSAEPNFDTELIELATRRGDLIESTLEGRYGVASDRLFRCRPTLEDDGAPRVDISL